MPSAEPSTPPVREQKTIRSPCAPKTTGGSWAAPPWIGPVSRKVRESQFWGCTSCAGGPGVEGQARRQLDQERASLGPQGGGLLQQAVEQLVGVDKPELVGDFLGDLEGEREVLRRLRRPSGVGGRPVARWNDELIATARSRCA
jgi:hypothetical protein